MSELRKIIPIGMSMLIASVSAPTLASSDADVCGLDPTGFAMNVVDLPNGGSSQLFPRLRPEDFPSEVGTLKVHPLTLEMGAIEADVSHRRTLDIGLIGRVLTSRSVDPRTRLAQTSMTRLDEVCLDTADAARLRAEEVCTRLVASEIQRGAVTLDFTSAYLNRDLRLTLVEDERSPGHWNLVPSGRRGEPRRLSLALENADSATLGVKWSIADAVNTESFRQELTMQVSRRDFERSGFDDLSLALLSAPSLFDNLVDDHAPWSIYAHEEDVFENPPDLGDDDIYGCHPVDGVCGAEYDTCLPTPGGWLGCNYYPGDTGWGGGHGGDGDGGLGTGGGHGVGGTPTEPTILPDWRAGSFLTTPKFPAPLFHDIHINVDANGNATHVGFTYNFTSVLQKAPTVPKPFTLHPSDYVTHVFGHFLTRDNDNRAICGLVRRQDTDQATVPVGDYVDYSTGGGSSICEREGIMQCTLPGPGIYLLRYDLDTFNAWDEGSTGEANNTGTFRGYFIKD
jgi:hypothetical protein